MKQFFPVILIGLFVAGVVYFMQDDYEPSLDAEIMEEIELGHWDVTFFLDELESGDPVKGIEVLWNEAGSELRDIQSLEMRVVSSAGRFFRQELALEDFDGRIKHKEACSQCADIAELHEIEGRVTLNWRIEGETEIISEYETFTIENIP